MWISYGNIPANYVSLPEGTDEGKPEFGMRGLGMTMRRTPCQVKARYFTNAISQSVDWWFGAWWLLKILGKIRPDTLLWWHGGKNKFHQWFTNSRIEDIYYFLLKMGTFQPAMLVYQRLKLPTAFRTQELDQLFAEMGQQSTVPFPGFHGGWKSPEGFRVHWGFRQCRKRFVFVLV